MSFQRELSDLITKYDLGSQSKIEDYVLAEFLESCLKIFNKTVQMRINLRQEKRKKPRGNKRITS